MEKSFDFHALLKKYEKKHKSKPTQFVSVTSGTQKRLQTNLKKRRSTRLSAFDSTRNLPRCEEPPPVSEAQQKTEHRRLQLEKWKAEKEQKKKELAALKKKPFLTGVARAPLKFEPPPPPPPKPSISGRVTRSQTRKITEIPKNRSPVKPTPKGRTAQSFAPKNASFKPPEMKTLAKLPKLAPPPKSRNAKVNINFDPVLPKTANVVTETRSRPALTRQNAISSKIETETRSTRGKMARKPSPKKVSLMQKSSSGSDSEPMKVTNRNPKIRKTPANKKSMRPVQNLISNKLALNSSTEKSVSDSSTETKQKKCTRKSIVRKSDFGKNSDVDLSSSEERATVISNSRKSSSHNSSSSLTSGSMSKSSTETAFVQEKLKVPTRKSLISTPKNRKNIPKSESSSEEKLRSPKSPIELPLTPEQMETALMSPCVTVSRGKDNARKEMKWKMDEGYLDDDASDQDSVEHFQKQLSSEVKRLLEMADTWDKILVQTVLPEPVQEAVLSAVGLARLLVSQKLAQFGTLLQRAARPPAPPQPAVTPADLHGFWDMVYMQVENVDMKFKKLEELRARNWTEKETPKPRARARPARPAARPARPAAAGQASRLRDVIAAARKAKKAGDSNLCPDEKTFEAGFFTVRSPLRSSPRSPLVVITPTANRTLLKHVLSSEAKKACSKSATPFAMLRASLTAKQAECDGVEPLPQTPEMTPMNLFATPGRSILKSANANSTKPAKKSIKVVLFDQSDSDSPTITNDATIFDQLDSDAPTITNDATISEYLTPINNNEVEQKTASTKKNRKSQEKENVFMSIIRTRSQRKSLIDASNPEAEQEIEVKTPKRSSRKKKEPSVERPSRKSTTRT